eukprot:gene4377-14502_t
MIQAKGTSARIAFGGKRALAKTVHAAPTLKPSSLVVDQVRHALDSTTRLNLSTDNAVGCRSSTRSSVVTQAGNDDKMMVAITGATGLVGSRLVAKLASKGHKVKVLTRNTSSAKSKLPYPGVEFVAPSNWATALSGCTGVVNLAGEPIATRWTPALKKQIKSSRLDVTKKVTVGYYGISYASSFNEESPSGNDYLAEVCRDWKAGAQAAPQDVCCDWEAGAQATPQDVCRDWEAGAQAAPQDVRTVVLRIGIVLAREGGALGKMVPAFQIFAETNS